MRGTKRRCSKGHIYFKNSVPITTGSPVCPVCEEEHKPEKGVLTLLSGPARRVLENAGIKTLKQLSAHSEREILSWHGMGPASLPLLRTVLKKQGLAFKKIKSTI
jgi:predicted RecB family nuclease